MDFQTDLRMRLRHFFGQMSLSTAEHFLWRLRGFVLGGLIGATVLFVASGVPEIRPDLNITRSARPRSSYMEVAEAFSWGNLFGVDAERRVVIQPGATYSSIDDLFALAAVKEFLDGRRDAAFRIVDAIPDEHRKAGVTFKLVERVRTLSAYHAVVPSDLFALIADRHTRRFPGVPFVAGQTPDQREEAERVADAKHAEELRIELDRTRLAEIEIVEAALAELARAASVAAKLADKQDAAALLFAIAENRRQLGSVHETFEKGIEPLESSGRPFTFLGFGLGTCLFGLWTVVIGVFTFFKEPIQARLFRQRQRTAVDGPSVAPQDQERRGAKRVTPK